MGTCYEANVDWDERAREYVVSYRQFSYLNGKKRSRVLQRLALPDRDDADFPCGKNGDSDAVPRWIQREQRVLQWVEANYPTHVLPSSRRHKLTDAACGRFQQFSACMVMIGTPATLELICSTYCGPSAKARSEAEDAADALVAVPASVLLLPPCERDPALLALARCALRANGVPISGVRGIDINGKLLDELSWQARDAELPRDVPLLTRTPGCAVLLTARLWVDTPDKVYVDLPGGKRELGETGAQAMVRELREETGISLSLGPGLRPLQAPVLTPAPCFHITAHKNPALRRRSRRVGITTCAGSGNFVTYFAEEAIGADGRHGLEAEERKGGDRVKREGAPSFESTASELLAGALGELLDLYGDEETGETKDEGVEPDAEGGAGSVDRTEAKDGSAQ